MASIGATVLGSNDWKYNYTPAQLSLMSGSDLASLYGINYDESSIKSKFDAATAAEYVTKKKEYKDTENAYYQSLYSLGNTAADSVRQALAAQATGASNAAINTNILTALLNLQSEGSTTATDLANQRNNLAAEEAEAYTQNTVDAMTTANDLKAQLMTNALSKYGYDVQNNVGEMQFWASLDTAAKEMWAAKYQADLNRGAMWI